MASRYSSFLVRWWHLGTGDERIAVEHIQTGERALLSSLPAALAWIEAHAGGAFPNEPTTLYPPPHDTDRPSEKKPPGDTAPH